MFDEKINNCLINIYIRKKIPFYTTYYYYKSRLKLRFAMVKYLCNLYLISSEK